MIVDPIFSSHRLSNKGVEKAETIRMHFQKLLDEVSKYTTGDERCKAVMRTKLEEASFFAIKSMAADQANQVKEGQ